MPLNIHNILGTYQPSGVQENIFKYHTDEPGLIFNLSRHLPSQELSCLYNPEESVKINFDIN